MSERGVFAVDRGIWDHDLFFDGEPLSRREAWLWLVSEAAWKERTRRIVGRPIELRRGQLVASLRFIASKWGWSEPRVRRFLHALVSEQMIDAKTDAGVTVITICKYDEYQRVSLPSDAMRASDDDAAATQQRRKTEDIKTIKSSSLRSESSDDWPDDFGDQFWQAYPRKTEKLAAMKKLAVVRKSGVVSFADLMAGVRRYAAADLDPQYTKHPTTWLNAGCWADETQPGATNGHRAANPRTTGHDAILAAASRAAGKIAGDGAMARPAAQDEFPEWNGTQPGRPGGADGSAGRADQDHHRRAPAADGVREGEIIPPDANADGVSGGWRRH